LLGHYQYKTILNVNINKKIKEQNYHIKTILDDMKYKYITYAVDEVFLNEKLVEAFANGDREALYEYALPIFENLKKYDNFLTIMNFHTADNHNFLRVQRPEVFGDDLTKLRPMVRETNLTQKPQEGFEVGKYALSYRVALPLFYKDKYIGVFEFGIDIRYIISQLSISETLNPLFIVSKESVKKIYDYDKNADKYLNSFNKTHALIKLQASSDEKDTLQEVLDERIVEEKSYLKEHEGKYYLVFRSDAIRDYENKELGHFIFKNDMNTYLGTIYFVRALSVVLTLFMIAFIAVLINKLIKEYSSKIEKQKNILDYQAHYDYLTGLANRALFHDRLQQSIEKGERQGTKFALLFLDLDRFKEINDSLGHDVGDKLLRITAKKLQSTLRHEDTISRLGGDEFTILIQDVKKEVDASTLAQKIITTLSEPMVVDGHTLYITGSIGISIYPDDGVDANNLLKYADAAMYKAKEEGRNNFQYYSSEMTELALQRVTMEANIRKALDNGEFVVYYQPQVEATTQKIVGMEALARWMHPKKGLITPDKFIPLAQETGLILSIDRFVMLSAMKQMSSWYKMGLNPGVLALNLSIKQLSQEGCVSKLGLLIQEAQCKPECLELEVTEGEIMKNPQNAIDVLNTISDMGIELAIDDFGTGYSSLSYLKRLPIDKLKIDKSFVDGLPNNEDDASITRAIIALAKSLKLRLIAEGVETKEQKEFLVENGCEHIQGYYYSKPLSAQEMEQVLKKGLCK
jgi:diguanylate cyclase (GGDEF)-like protein